MPPVAPTDPPGQFARRWPFRSGIPNLRWWIAFLLFLSTVIDYISRETLSVAAPTLTRRFHLSASDYAHITAAFLAGYTIMPLLGKLLDWLGTKRGLSMSVFWWSVIGILHAFAQGFLSLFSLRFLLGLAEGLNWPGATKAVSEWFPPSERSFAAGFFDSGSSVGAIIAVPLVALLILHFGWRTAFVCTGALGFFWVLVWQIAYHPWQRHPALGEKERQLLTSSLSAAEDQPLSSSTRSLLRYKQIWAIMLGRACTDSVWWFYVFWLPQYLVGARGFSLRLLATLGWVPFLFADLGNFFGGGTSMWLAKHGRSLTRARKTVLLCCGIMMILAAPATMLPGDAAVISTISVWTFFYAGFSTILLALPSDLFAPSEVGVAAGLCQAGSGAGAIVVQLFIGALLDRYHSYTSVLVLATFLPLIATLCTLTMIPKVDLLRKTEQTVTAVSHGDLH